jgi:signal recognition particle GTPase
MFDTLTSSVGATFKKLLGRKTLTKEEVDVALASVNDALVDADVAQVTKRIRCCCIL